MREVPTLSPERTRLHEAMCAAPSSAIEAFLSRWPQDVRPMEEGSGYAIEGRGL